MKFLDFYQENKLKVWILVITLPTIFLIVGSLILPDLFWDSFLFRYIWGPVIADARGEPVNGISEGYNLVNTFAYGVVISVALLGIYEIIQHYNIEVDKRFILSLIPWILLGGALRALEDAGLFRERIAPFFISPIIYFALGISAILTMVLGCKLKDANVTNLKRAMVLLPPVVVFLSLRLEFYAVMAAVMVTVLTIFYFIGIRYSWNDEKYLFSAYGTAFLTVSLTYTARYILILPDPNPWEIPIILGLALLVSSVFMISAYLLREVGGWRSAGIFFSTLNIPIVLAHFLDASSTYRGITEYGYVEKHVIPHLLINITGTPLVMYVLKLILIVSFIYVIDLMLREELEDLKVVTNLVKFTIIVLGLAPGTRNMLRLAMGV
ncbi:MAG: DUF63 family protein [Candidatus Saliniplasma sp.]